MADEADSMNQDESVRMIPDESARMIPNKSAGMATGDEPRDRSGPIAELNRLSGQPERRNWLDALNPIDNGTDPENASLRQANSPIANNRGTHSAAMDGKFDHYVHFHYVHFSVVHGVPERYNEGRDTGTTGLKDLSTIYNRIGLQYADLRHADSRIAQRIESALGTGETILNVGAGAGSYEPRGKKITAVEPSVEMIKQRAPSDVTVIQGVAEDLPFADKSFDASMAVLTIHHWSDHRRGVAEMRRVTRGNIVFLTYDPSFNSFWPLDYFPEFVKLDEKNMPPIADFKKWLGAVDVEAVPIPRDCTDGFLAAYWQRPSAYLDERVRAAISSFWALGDISDRLKRLETDLRNGAWEQRYGSLLDLDELDCGYRLVVAR